jgi:hypothetical protein
MEATGTDCRHGATCDGGDELPGRVRRRTVSKTEGERRGKRCLRVRKRKMKLVRGLRWLMDDEFVDTESGGGALGFWRLLCTIHENRSLRWGLGDAARAWDTIYEGRCVARTPRRGVVVESDIGLGQCPARSRVRGRRRR